MCEGERARSRGRERERLATAVFVENAALEQTRAREAGERAPGARAIVRRWGELLDRHGARAVFIARLLPLARTFVSLPAGARRVRLVPFIVLTTIGCALWAAAFVLVGVIAGDAWAAVGTILGSVLLALGMVTLVLSLTRR